MQTHIPHTHTLTQTRIVSSHHVFFPHSLSKVYVNIPTELLTCIIHKGPPPPPHFDWLRSLPCFSLALVASFGSLSEFYINIPTDLLTSIVNKGPPPHFDWLPSLPVSIRQHTSGLDATPYEGSGIEGDAVGIYRTVFAAAAHIVV